MSLAEAFAATAGHAPDGVWSAPGRVNLIGEHTDYNDGFALPFALPMRTSVAAARRAGGVLQIRSRQRLGEVTEVALGDLEPGRPAGWPGYVAGVAWALRAAGHDVVGADLLVDSDVPVGAGLSSSAALECATALALCDLSGLRLDPAEIARLAQRAENGFVGVPCGLMDQMAAMTSTAGHAVFFDARSQHVEPVPLDPSAAGLTLLVIDTHAKHANADGAYAERRASCEAAARALGVAALRDVTADDLGRLTDPVLRRRARHVVAENQRVLAAVALLRDGRAAEVGPLLTASHVSLRHDFEVSAPELDAVVDAALEAGALGARMTGAGFGGCAVALVEDDLAPSVAEAVADETAHRRFPSPTVWPAVPSAGAHRENVPTERAHPVESLTPHDLEAASPRLDMEGAPAWRP